jgi:hypothetical protein
MNSIPNTYRIRSPELAYSIVVDAGSAGEAILFGALYLLIHRLINSLEAGFTAEPWNASLEEGEYVPASYFAGIVPQLTALVAGASRCSRGHVTENLPRA